MSCLNFNLSKPLKSTNIATEIVLHLNLKKTTLYETGLTRVSREVGRALSEYHPQIPIIPFKDTDQNSSSFVY